MAELPYSEDALFDEMVDKDPTVEIIGYVESIEGRRQIKQYVLFKFVLTNGNRRITCLIWGDQLIQQYQSDVLIGRIIHLDAVKSKTCNLNQQRLEQNYVPFELIIQSNTTAQYLGYHQVEAEPVQVPQEITFDDIGHSEGLIVIEGFLKTVFTRVPSQYNNMSYGVGSITNGIFKVTVQVTNFNQVAMDKGVAVRVTGVLSAEGLPLRIECQNMTDIVVSYDRQAMTHEQLLRAVRTPRRRRDE